MNILKLFISEDLHYLKFFYEMRINMFSGRYRKDGCTFGALHIEIMSDKEPTNQIRDNLSECRSVIID